MGKTNPGTKKVITVWLDSEGGNESEYYFCPHCRIVIVEYNGTLISEVPGGAPVSPQTIIKCKGNFRRKDGEYEECGRYYIFAASIITKNPQST